MTEVLLSLHVLAAVICIGPVTVAASLFPRYARDLLRSGAGDRDRALVGLLHRISRVYGRIAVVVPLLGLATAISLGVLGDGWVLVAIALTGVAAVLLVGVILPVQRELIDTAPGDVRPGLAEPMLARVALATGMFNVLWTVVVVLMVVRPGSTTGA